MPSRERKFLFFAFLTSLPLSLSFDFNNMCLLNLFWYEFYAAMLEDRIVRRIGYKVKEITSPRPEWSIKLTSARVQLQYVTSRFKSTCFISINTITEYYRYVLIDDFQFSSYYRKIEVNEHAVDV